MEPALPRDLHDLPLPWDDPRFVSEAEPILAFSRFACDVLRRYPDAVSERWRAGAMAGPRPPVVRAAAGPGEAEALAALRVSRHLGLFEILWRDVAGVSGVEATLGETSDLADALIAAALGHARAGLERFGTPRSPQGEALDLIVLGLGKLGGRELNFSSDVDLVYAYAARGETDGRRSVANEDYFRRLGTALSRLLGQVTEDGLCYRVDLRLRPYGTAGRVALSAGAMEQYFEREGRSWERYAWIKARALAGDLAGGRAILAALRPFVFRRYLDFGAFESLREMKAMIRADVERRELTDHIKLGRGGIREIEFFAQAFQLIRGGREPSLRTRSLLGALAALAELGEIGPDTRDQLSEAYRFLRRLENRFQQVGDQQTHCPPVDAAVRAAVAASLGYATWDALEAAWRERRELVASCFDAVFEPESGGESRPDAWAVLWKTPSSARESWRALLERFQATAAVRLMSARSRARLDRLMPALLREIAELPDERQSGALERVLAVIEAVARRSTYLAMMTEQEEVLKQVVSLCARSRWIADRLVRHPLLLDELIARRVSPVERNLEAHLARRLATAEGDLELEMEILREVRDARMLHLAVELLSGRVTAGGVSLRLATTTDAVLGAVCRLAWRDVTRRHGSFGEAVGGIAIIGYGTLGGRELSFDSDLDLVFLYGAVPPERQSDGARPLDALTFYTRLSQRILHLTTTQTASGRLFEVDTRLRPNGRSGMLVTSLPAFCAYQRERAWTWELQALSRARWVAGEEHLVAPFDALRREMLERPRDPETLAREVVEMREKMRAQLDRSGDGGFDLKQGRGGRIDLEFLVQYARLRWAREDAALADTRGTAEGLFALAEAGRLERGRADELLSVYEGYRRCAMEAALAQDRALARPDAFGPERRAVVDLWERWLG